jgi:hypothetical protein
MNVQEEVQSVRQIHFVVIPQDHMLYVNCYVLKEKMIFSFLKCDCISGYKMLNERTFCEGIGNIEF